MGNAWRLGGSDRFDQAALEEVCYLDAVNFLVWLREPTPPPPTRRVSVAAVVAAPGSWLSSNQPPLLSHLRRQSRYPRPRYAVANAVALVRTMADDASGSGASDCIPIQAGALKKGSHVVLKGFPCKIVEYSYVSLFCCALWILFGAVLWMV